MPTPKLTVRELQGIDPALPDRTTTDFEDQIEEAMEDEAQRIVDAMEGASTESIGTADP